MMIWYLYIPMFLFFWGWTRWYCALAATVVSLYGIYKMENRFLGTSLLEMLLHGAKRVLERRANGDFEKNHSDDYVEKQAVETVKDVSISIVMFIVVILSACALGLLSGWGGWMPQAGDWHKTNAVLSDLITHDWPVYFQNGGEWSMLTYYIGHYLVPAAVGTLCGHSFRVGEIAFFAWSVLGLILILFNIIRILQADRWWKALLTVTIFSLFSGMLLPGQFLHDILFGQKYDQSFGIDHYMDLSLKLQYRSNFVAMRWITPACIAVWIATLLLWEHRQKIEDYVAMLLPAMLCGAVSFLGIASIAVGYAALLFVRAVKEKQMIPFLRRLFSVSNIFVALINGGVLFLYYYGNAMSEKPPGLGLGILHYGERLPMYFIFCFFMFGIYSICIGNRYKRDGLFWVTNVMLLVFPFFTMGIANDFTMGTGIPAMFIIMLFVMDYLMKERHVKREAQIKAILAVCLMIGAISPIREMWTVISTNDMTQTQELNDYGTLGNYANRAKDDVPVDLIWNYFSYDIDTNLFVNYIARPHEL